MSGNANTTISGPGPDWKVLWNNGPNLHSFQLDIVGFLAVLGEASVTANAQVSALSRLFFLPRLIPAPQALLPPNRAVTLPSTKAWVTSVHTGNVKEHVHHVAHILLGDDMPTFMVRCVEVTKRKNMRQPTRMDTLLRGVQRSKTASPDMTAPSVKAKATGPLSWVTLLGFFLSISLFTISLLLGDGMSLLATLCLSFLSTLIGIANKWNLKLPKRPTGALPVAGDTVIRYPKGSFLVVRCDEDVARELYFAPEEIEYDIKNATTYRMISLVGTLILMAGIVFLANAKLQLQFAWLGAYAIINAAHWIAAAMPAKSHWDISCYEVREQGVEGGPKNKTFTEALWKAVLLTKSIRWVRNGDAAPQTDVWDDWLDSAEEMANKASYHFGPLTDPMWPGDNPNKATIWDQPKNWDAKKAWDAIDSEKRGTMHGSHQPVTAG